MATTETEAQPIPVNAAIEHDFITNLILLFSTDTVEQACARVAECAIGSRLPEQDAPLQMIYEGDVLDPSVTVTEAGITPLSEVFVRYAPAGATNG